MAELLRAHYRALLHCGKMRKGGDILTKGYPMFTSTRPNALWRRLVALAESRPDVRALNRLNATTDEDLAARGLTRVGEVHRIMGARFYI